MLHNAHIHTKTGQEKAHLSSRYIVIIAKLLTTVGRCLYSRWFI